MNESILRCCGCSNIWKTGIQRSNLRLLQLCLPNPIFTLVLTIEYIELEDLVISKVPFIHRGLMSAEKTIVV